VLSECRDVRDPTLTHSILSPTAVTKNKKAAGQALARVRNGLIGSFAW
jgi:hypothetical protein